MQVMEFLQEFFSARSRVPGFRPSPTAHARVRHPHHSWQTDYGVLSVPVAAGPPCHCTVVGSNPSAHRPKNLTPASCPLHHIYYFDIEKEFQLIFLSNHSLFSALTITELYRARSLVELFFPWIKQNPHIAGKCASEMKICSESAFFPSCEAALDKVPAATAQGLFNLWRQKQASGGRWQRWRLQWQRRWQTILQLA